MTSPILSTEYRRKPVAARLAQARRVITAALGNPRILRALHEFGYGRTLLHEGLDLVVRAEAARERVTRTRPVSTMPGTPPVVDEGASPAADPTSAELRDGQALARLARKAFARDRVARTQLELDVPFPATPFLALQMLERLAHTLLVEDEYVRRMEASGMSPERLADLARDLSAARAAAYLRHRTLGLRQEAASEARRTLSALDAWMSDFYRVVKVALQDAPSALAILEVRVVDRPGCPMSGIDKKS